MFLRKTVENSFSLAMMGLALSGVAVGQVAGPGIGNGNVGIDAQIDADLSANPPKPASDVATPESVNANNNANTNLGAQVNGVQAGVDAASRTNSESIKSDVQSTANAGLGDLINRPNAALSSNATTNANPFGAAFDSSTSDRLIIQNLQPNSMASRLGLQAGDRIIGFNGQTYNDVNQFDRDLSELNGNSDVPFIYERNGQRFTQQFRMSATDVQQNYGSANDGNQGSNAGSGTAGPISYSANRPSYGMSSSNGYTGGMNVVGMAGCGAISSYGSEPVYAQQCCSVNRQHGHNRAYQHGGRRHRHNCR